MTEKKTIKNKDVVTTGFEGIVVSKNKTIKKKEFSILDLKKKVETVTAYKDEYIPFSFAVQDAIRLKGLPTGHIHQIIGHPNTGKSSLLFEVGVSAQKQGILPIFLITENKFDWGHLELLGFDRGEEVDQDENGNPIYGGHYLYIDGFFNIEDIFLKINKILDLQEKEEIPYDIIFLIDSFGSLPSKMSSIIKEDGSQKGSNMNEATVYSGHLKGLKSRIGMSRKKDSKFTNTVLIVNQSYIAPAMTPIGKPKIVPRGGTSLVYSSTYIFRCGGIIDSGVSKETCIVGGKKVVVGYSTKIAIEKNHEDYFTISEERIFLCPHGFLKLDKSEIERYKIKMRPLWEERLKEIDSLNEGLEVDEETGEILSKKITQPIKAEL